MDSLAYRNASVDTALRSVAIISEVLWSNAHGFFSQNTTVHAVIM